jgi:peptide deformylase
LGSARQGRQQKANQRYNLAHANPGGIGEDASSGVEPIVQGLTQVRKMAILKILQYPDPRLHKVAQPVAEVTPATRKLIADMAETMYAAPGVGLAATQVDVHEQVIVADVSEKHDELLVFINPELIAVEGESKLEEGCLSVPGIYDKVKRAERVTVRALNKNGKPFTLEADGLLAVCIQHEIDHLKGRVFVEYLSQLKQSRIRNKLKKRQREAM